MANLTEIKEQLNVIHQEYKDNKSQLNVEKTKTAAKLIYDISLCDGSTEKDVAKELVRFPIDVVKIYFEKITIINIPVSVVDNIIKEMRVTDSQQSQYYISKYNFAIISIVKSYREKITEFSQLPWLVLFNARQALKRNKYKEKFDSLIRNTNGEVFNLDYSNMDKSKLGDIWDAVQVVYPDYMKTKSADKIRVWAETYGLIKKDGGDASLSNENDVTDKENKQSDTLDTTTSKGLSMELDSSDPMKDSLGKNIDIKSEHANTEKAVISNSNVTISNIDDITLSKLYFDISTDMSRGQKKVISSVQSMIEPLTKAIESVKGEIDKARALGSENVSLSTKNGMLEQQLHEVNKELQTVKVALDRTKAESDALKKQIATLEDANVELDTKLKDVYAINSRESSLEAEKVREELKKSFAMLYEDWLEYEYSDVSEENYESLLAIIKKVFRSLEMNGIDFKRDGT